MNAAAAAMVISIMERIILKKNFISSPWGTRYWEVPALSQVFKGSRANAMEHGSHASSGNCRSGDTHRQKRNLDYMARNDCCLPEKLVSL